MHPNPSAGRIRGSIVASAGLFVIAVVAVGWMQGVANRFGAEARELAARNGALLARLRQERELIAALNSRPAAPIAHGQPAATEARTPAAEPAGDAAAADPAIAAEASAWIARWQALHAQAVQHPEALIPEISLLGEMDWLQVARAAEFDTPEHARQSLAALRTAAKQKFAEQLSAALRRFLGVTAGRLPLGMEALAPYFDPPVDGSILQRYEFVHTTDGRAPPAGVSFIRERTLVDEQYDTRYGVDASGAIAPTPAPGSAGM